MALDRNPTINVPSLNDPLVLGSGKYAFTEMMELTRLKAQAAVTERELSLGIQAFFAATNTDPAGDTAQEIAAFEEGIRIAGKRLLRDYRVLLLGNSPTLQDVRNSSLRQIINGFAFRDTDADGKLDKTESGLHDRLFADLDVDADGFLSEADLAKGIKE